MNGKALRRAVSGNEVTIAFDENRKSGDRLSSVSRPSFDGRERTFP
jgi:hypothetical protein